jgi:hypothetical protein
MASSTELATALAADVVDVDPDMMEFAHDSTAVAGRAGAAAATAARS